MTFSEIIHARRSVRSYTSQAVESDKLDAVLESARLAPSACNCQPWLFIVINETENRNKLHACYDRDWFKSAPVYIIACANHQQSWKRKADGKDHADIDLSIAIEHICLSAVELGLGTCWVCNFNVPLCKEYFHLPEHIEPVAIIPIGYPDPQHPLQTTSRKNTNEIVKREESLNTALFPGNTSNAS
ncbi:MAG: nitroreductase family protein [Dysgonamonadaceae bacterium]|jgi:nitroreductase|nr:nitroreductase family protein [Dysgonamonadaceae bacterium]